MGAQYDQLDDAAVEGVPMTALPQRDGVVVADEDPLPRAPIVVAVVSTTEEVDASVEDFIPACLSTFFFHLCGLLCVFTFWRSDYGKAGAVAGYACLSLKMLVVGLLAVFVVSHYHTPRVFSPAEFTTQATCEAHYGVWAVPLEHNALYWRPTGPSSETSSTPSCQCPLLYFRREHPETHQVVCVDSRGFWMATSLLALSFFALCSSLVAYYLQRGNARVAAAAEAADVVIVAQPAYVAEEKAPAPAPTMM